MSNLFSNTGSNFGPSNIYRQQDVIREIVQNEVLLLFEDIKEEIEMKIKSIDRNIFDLRNQLRNINFNNKQQKDLAELNAKI